MTETATMPHKHKKAAGMKDIHIYIYRERERERRRQDAKRCTSDRTSPPNNLQTPMRSQTIDTVSLRQSPEPGSCTDQGRSTGTAPTNKPSSPQGCQMQSKCGSSNNATTQSSGKPKSVNRQGTCLALTPIGSFWKCVGAGLCWPQGCGRSSLNTLST